MKKDIRLLDGLVYSTFFIMTTIILFMLYKDIPSKAVLNFVMAYAMLAIIIPFYILMRVLFTVKHFNFYEVKQEGVKFLAIFLGLLSLKFISNTLLPTADINIIKTMPSTLILTLGLVCFDIIFLKKAK